MNRVAAAAVAVFVLSMLAGCELVDTTKEEAPVIDDREDYFPLAADRTWVFEFEEEYSGGVMAGPRSRRGGVTLGVEAVNGANGTFEVRLRREGEVQNSYYDPYQSRYVRDEWRPFEESQLMTWHDADSLDTAGWLGKIARLHDPATPDTIVVVVGDVNPVTPDYRRVTLVRDVGPVAFTRYRFVRSWGVLQDTWTLTERR